MDGVDSLDEALSAIAILAAEAFVDDQGLKPGAGPLGQDLGQSQADGEINANCSPQLGFSEGRYPWLSAI